MPLNLYWIAIILLLGFFVPADVAKDFILQDPINGISPNLLPGVANVWRHHFTQIANLGYCYFIRGTNLTMKAVVDHERGLALQTTSIYIHPF